jgi:hypothetical protein
MKNLDNQPYAVEITNLDSVYGIFNAVSLARGPVIINDNVSVDTLNLAVEMLEKEEVEHELHYL